MINRTAAAVAAAALSPQYPGPTDFESNYGTPGEIGEATMFQARTVADTKHQYQFDVKGIYSTIRH